ncbi:MAG: hypothetical protein ABL955_04145 [Elusimicrobiota bacterium]
MESMTPLFVVMAALFALNNYSTVMASRRAAGQDAPDAVADMRALAWRAVAKGMRKMTYAALFGYIGWMFVTKPFLVRESTLGQAVAVFGGGLLLFGAVMFLFGASSLVNAFGLLRDAKRVAEESQS